MHDAKFHREPISKDIGSMKKRGAPPLQTFFRQSQIFLISGAPPPNSALANSLHNVFSATAVSEKKQTPHGKFLTAQAFWPKRLRGETASIEILTETERYGTERKNTKRIILHNTFTFSPAEKRRETRRSLFHIQFRACVPCLIVRTTV